MVKLLGVSTHTQLAFLIPKILRNGKPSKFFLRLVYMA